MLEVEEVVLCDAEGALFKKQAKVNNQTEEQIKETNDLEQDKIDTFDNVEKNERIKLINKNYEVDIDSIKTKASKLQTIILDQVAQTIAQGLSEVEKSKSQKESLIQQVQ